MLIDTRHRGASAARIVALADKLTHAASLAASIATGVFARAATVWLVDPAMGSACVR